MYNSVYFYFICMILQYSEDLKQKQEDELRRVREEMEQDQIAELEVEKERRRHLEEEIKRLKDEVQSSPDSRRRLPRPRPPKAPPVLSLKGISSSHSSGAPPPPPSQKTSSSHSSKVPPSPPSRSSRAPPPPRLYLQDRNYSSRSTGVPTPTPPVPRSRGVPTPPPPLSHTNSSHESRGLPASQPQATFSSNSSASSSSTMEFTASTQPTTAVRTTKSKEAPFKVTSFSYCYNICIHCNIIDRIWIYHHLCLVVWFI